MKKIVTLLTLFTTLQSHCAQGSDITREKLIEEYKTLIEHAQNFLKRPSKNKDFLQESTLQILKTAETELYQLINRQNQTKEELVNSIKLLHDLYS